MDTPEELQPKDQASSSELLTETREFSEKLQIEDRLRPEKSQFVEELKTKARECLGSPKTDILSKFFRSPYFDVEYPNEDGEVSYFRELRDPNMKFDVTVKDYFYHLCPELFIGETELYQSNDLRPLKKKFPSVKHGHIIIFRKQGDPEGDTLVKMSADNVYLVNGKVVEKFVGWLDREGYRASATDVICVEDAKLDDRFNLVE